MDETTHETRSSSAISGGYQQQLQQQLHHRSKRSLVVPTNRYGLNGKQFKKTFASFIEEATEDSFSRTPISVTSVG